jgi:hypothetical protein
MAVGALGQTASGQRIMSSARRGPPLGMSSFWIGHVNSGLGSGKWVVGSSDVLLPTAHYPLPEISFNAAHRSSTAAAWQAHSL